LTSSSEILPAQAAQLLDDLTVIVAHAARNRRGFAFNGGAADESRPNRPSPLLMKHPKR
jgi:hypothetical protein